MPTGKYYCDYCDKEFQDTPAARSRHLQGSVHLRNRQLWYDSLKVAEQFGGSLVQPDGTMPKGLCQHYVRTGICKYGDNCKYFHPKPEMINTTTVTPGSIIGNMVQVPNSLVNQPTGVSSLSGGVLNQLSNWGNLPPSLQPPPEGGYPTLPFVDWG